MVPFATTCQLICRWEPLPVDVLHTHADDLDFAALSMNQALPWTPELLLKFVDRWIPMEVMRNPAVPWDDALIRAYGRRADPFYLGQNSRLNPEQSQAQKLPPPAKIGDLVFDAVDGVDPEAELASLDATLLVRLEPKLLAQRLAEAPIDWTDILLDTLLPMAHKLLSCSLGEVLYRARVRPADPLTWLERGFGACPFLKIDGIRNDDYGLVPGVDLGFDEIDEAVERGRGPVPGRVGAFKEGPNRFHHVVRSHLFAPGLVVHRALVPVFDAHRLPPHFWAELHIDHPDWKDEHVLLLVQQAIDSRGPLLLEEATDVVGLVRVFEKDSTNKTPPGGLLASRRLVAALREAGTTGLMVETCAGHRVEMPALGSVAPYQVDLAPADDPRSADYRYYEAKRTRLEASPARLSTELAADRPLRDVEARLQCAFPEGFATWLAEHEGERLGDSFTCCHAEDLERLDDSVLFLNHPEAYGAVVFATDGCGDSLFLQLAKRSDTMLKQTFYRVHHGSGQVERWS